MGCVYFSIPVVAGYAVSNWVVTQSEATVDKRFADVGKCVRAQRTATVVVFRT